MKRTFLLIIMVFIFNLSFSQGGYKLDFKIKGWKDTVVWLGSYFRETTYINDTAQVDKNGAFTFQNNKPLPQGVYFLVKKTGKENIRLFEFVVGHNQKFAMETAAPDYVLNMKVKGDHDNQLFFDNIAYNIERNKEVTPFIAILRDSTLKEDQKKAAREGYSKVSEKVMTHQRELIAANPTTMTARMLNALLPVVVPEPPKKADGSIDSTFRLRYYRQHYFDNFDLSDEAMLRLPRFMHKEKIKEYLEKLIVPQPDSVTKAIQFLVASTKKNQDAFGIVVWNSLIMYQLPEIMGLDEVFVNIYDQYFANGQMDAFTPAQTKEQFKDWAEKIRPCMIGRKGTNLVMQDENFQPRSMYDIKQKYTVLFIFSPTCGHCRTDTPKLLEFYNKNKTKLDLEVFAVATDSTMKLMREFIKEFKTPWITVNGPRSYNHTHFSKFYQADSTPMIYVLDDRKTIIGKKLSASQLEDFLIKHERFVQMKKSKERQ